MILSMKYIVLALIHSDHSSHAAHSDHSAHGSHSSHSSHSFHNLHTNSLNPVCTSIGTTLNRVPAPAVLTKTNWDDLISKINIVRSSWGLGGI